MEPNQHVLPAFNLALPVSTGLSIMDGSLQLKGM